MVSVKHDLWLMMMLSSCFARADDFAQTLHQTMWATFLHRDNQTEKARNWYNRLTRRPTSIYSLKGYITFLSDKEQYAAVVDYLPTIKTHFSRDPDMQRLLVNALLRVGRVAEADAHCLAVHKHFPLHTEIALQATQALVRAQRIEDALAIVQSIVNKGRHKQSAFFFYFLQAQLLLKLGKPLEAREAVQQCLTLRPSFTNGWLLLSLLDLQAGNLEKATEEYASFLKMNGARNTHLESYLAATKTKQQLVRQNNLLQNQLFQKAVLLYKAKNLADALVAINESITQEGSNPYHKLLKIQILVDLHNIKGALAQMLAWMNQGQERPLWLNIARFLATSCPREHALILNTFASALYANPNDASLQIYLADVCASDENYADASLHYSNTAALTRDPLLKAVFYCKSALFARKQRDFATEHAMIQAGLTQKVLYPPLLNQAAYYYATKGKNIPKAQKYVRKALAKEPNNIHYMDTQAKILYKLRLHNKAELLLSSIVEKFPTEWSPLLHLAKAKFKLGKKNEAVLFMQRAQEVVHEKYEQEILARLKQKWDMQ